MKDKNEKYSYFMSFGMLLGSALGSISSIFFQGIAMIYFITGGTVLGFGIGFILYAIFSSKNNSDDN